MKDASNRGGGRGVSLLELLLVLAILGTLAVMAVPRYARSLARYRAETTANRVVSALRLARHEATTRSVSVEVVFDLPPANRLRIPGASGLDEPGSAFTIELAASPFEARLVSVALDDPLSAGDAPNAVVFNGWGVPDSGGTIVVAAGAESRTIDLDPVSGEASVR